MGPRGILSQLKIMIAPSDLGNMALQSTLHNILKCMILVVECHTYRS